MILRQSQFYIGGLSHFKFISKLKTRHHHMGTNKAVLLLSSNKAINEKLPITKYLLY